MKLDVKNLVLSDIGENETFDLNFSNEKIDDDLLAKKIEGKVKVTKLEDEILAQFSGTATIKTNCDRCLSEYVFELPFSFAQDYLLERSQKDEGEMVVSKEFEIEIREPVRQEIIAAMPVKKLCRQDCVGLCSHCGVNLNNEKCRCQTAEK